MKKATIVLAIVVLAAAIAFIMLRREDPKQSEKPKFSDEEYNAYYDAKESGIEAVMGKMCGLVGHAIIPFQIGGAVDMYYFTNGIPGTGFATMELIEPDGSGPKPNRIGTYELVAFTKIKMPAAEEKSENHPFNKIERRMCGILSTTGFYSYDAVLNPGDTCEVPGKEGEPNKCLILDEFKPDGKEFRIGTKHHCLLLCIEVFRSEMEYAMAHGSATVLQKLKDKGYYPYSDLDREPVF